MQIKDIIKEIRKKKELATLDEKFVKDRIDEYVKENKLDLKTLEKRTSKYKNLFKHIRRVCFDVYGLFKVQSGDTLETHISSRERLLYYSTIYENIFEVTGKPKKILDLGCGVNPLSYFDLGCKPEYFASELSKEDCKVIDKFFKAKKIKGKCFAFDLVNGDYSKLPKADVCFLFKVLESLETIRKNISLEILQNINCNWIVVSFAKKTVTGKPILKKGRSWLKRMLKELGYNYDIIDIGDEIFYIIKK